MDLMALVSEKQKSMLTRRRSADSQGRQTLILDIPNMKTNSLIPHIDGR
jgi:competence protein ComGF